MNYLFKLGQNFSNPCGGGGVQIINCQIINAKLLNILVYPGRACQPHTNIATSLPKNKKKHCGNLLMNLKGADVKRVVTTLQISLVTAACR